MSLLAIKDVAQEVADSIAAVLGVEVTIIDDNYIRVAATGSYRNLVGKRIPENCLFEVILGKKEPKFICPTQSNSICSNCAAQGECIELATIGYPIKNNTKVYGLIGIDAFHEHQKIELISKNEQIMLFLSKLSGLLIATMSSYNMIKKLKIQSQEIRMIIDNFSKAILCINNTGKIKYFNNSALHLLNISSDELVDNLLSTILPDIDIASLNELSQETKISIVNKKSSFFINANPVILQGTKVSTLIEITKTKDMIMDAYNIIEGNRMILFDDILGNSKSLTKVKDIARNVSKSSSTVMLRGESGTGKELFARAIHNESPYAAAPFIAINCASIPDNLLESELFGYEGGSFTGSKRDGQMGKFELANGGTIFLDEIGDMPLHLQPKILRVLQEKMFTRIGGKTQLSLNARLIVATNKNLEQMVENSEFREDLYYRINIIPIFIPSLNDRKDDIPLLWQFVLDKYCTKLETGEKTLSAELKKLLCDYTWPGNIRELENVIEYLVNISKSDILTPENLPVTLKNKIYKILLLQYH